MKKIIPALALSLLSPLAFSDSLLGIHAEVGRWNADYHGDLGDPSINVRDLRLRESDNNFYSLALEHGVPLIPNVKLQYTDITSSQSATISDFFTLDGTAFLPGTEVDTHVDLSHTDLILYYQLLDNTVELDLGLNVRRFDGYVEASSFYASEKAKLDETIPLVYAKAMFHLPFSGFAAGIEGSFIKYDGNRLSDYTAKVRYLFDGAIDLGVELGYREMSFDIDESVVADVSLKGPYAALLLHF